MVHRWGESGQELKRSKNLEGEAETHAAYWFVPAQPLSYIIPDPGRHNPSGKSFSTSILITKKCPTGSPIGKGIFSTDVFVWDNYNLHQVD